MKQLVSTQLKGTHSFSYYMTENLNINLFYITEIKRNVSVKW